LITTEPDEINSSQERREPRPAAARKRLSRMGSGGGLFLWLGFRKADHALTVLELTALAEKIDTLEALQNTTLGLDGAFTFETGMLAHNLKMGAKNGGVLPERQSHFQKNRGTLLPG
jgi:hypothetical protein